MIADLNRYVYAAMRIYAYEGRSPENSQLKLGYNVQMATENQLKVAGIRFAILGRSIRTKKVGRKT